ncbi:MAG: dTDP-4-dehydrorhamnose 3,5-epimerase family protein [Parcubacteria group bacterium]|jgi:dTDP-4-dehydrorhamnose 3,5-epimerase
MINGVIIKNLSKYTDERGWLAEIFRNDEITTHPEMAYVSATKPGIVRGPHEHVDQTDIFVFIGPGTVELNLWDRRENSATRDEHVKIEMGENNPTMAIVPPGVVHAYKCVSQNDAWCINLPDKLYRGEQKKEEVDEIRWENVADSPFKI